MKRTFFLLVLIAIFSPTLSVAAVEATPQPAQEDSASVLSGVAPLGATILGGYAAMKRFPEHRKQIMAITGATIAAWAYFDRYALLALAGPLAYYAGPALRYLGPAYCVAATPYFGHCPCCPPGCMWIMGC